MITITTQGLVSRDSLERPDGALTTPWEVLGSAAIVANFLKAPGSGSAGNRPGARYNISLEASDELLTQVEGRFTDGGGNNGLHHAHCTPGARTGYGLHADNGDSQITEWLAFSPTGLLLEHDSRAANTIYTSQLHTKDALQRASVEHAAGLRTLETADTSHDGVAKIPYVWRNNLNTTSQSAQYRKLLWMRGATIVVNGPNTSWIARLKRADGSVVKDELAVGGVATLELMRGFGADEWVPWDGWARIEIIEGGESGSAVDYLDVTEDATVLLYPGTVLEWDGEPIGGGGGGGELPEPDPDRPAAADPSSVLFDFVPATDAMLMARSLRAGPAWAFQAREFQRLLRNQSTLEMEYVARERYRLTGELVQPPSATLVPGDPSDFSGFDLDAGVTLETPARGAFAGIQGTKLTADGSAGEQGARLDLGTTYSGDPEVLTVFASGGSRVDVGMWDADSSDWVVLASFDLGAGTAEVIGGSGDAWIERKRRYGVGYDVFALRVRGATLDYAARSLAIFPAGAEQAPGTCVVYWYQWEASGFGSNPLEAGMPAGGQLWVPGAPDPATASAYFRQIMGQPSDADGWVWHLGALNGDPPYWGVRLEAGAIVTEHDNGTDAPVTSEVAGSWTFGDELEGVATLMPAGAVHLVASLRGAAAAQGPLSADAALAEAWAGENAVVLGRGAGQARIWHKRLLILRADHLRSVPSVASQGEVMGEHRRYAVRTTGSGDLL